MGCSNSKAVEYAEIINLCEYPGVAFKEEIKVINGSNRNVAAWVPEEVPIKAVIIVSHGLNEHILRYAGISIELAKRGYAVHGIDHVSHGKSDGRRAVIADHKVMYEDFIAFGNDVHAQYPTLPLFLLAHSMGTLVGMMSINRIPDLRAAVLSGPAIFSGPGSSSPFGIRCLYPLSQTSLAVCLTSVTSSLDPAGPAAPLVATEISSDPAELELIRHDPRMAPPVVTNKSAYSVVKLIGEVKAEIPNIKVSLRHV
jgi:alpha-beta hydrolase superfamily lysophospholipase